MRPLLLLLLASLASAGDTLDDLLARAGTNREELGWAPRGWWARYPRTAPHKLDHFEGLFEEPLATVPFLRILGRTARQYLDAAELGKRAEKSDGALYKLAYGLGVERKYGGFRSYSANLTATETPLDQAILQLYRYADRRTRFVTFGQESPYPLLEKELAAAAAVLSPETSRILGRLVLHVVDAHRWATLAFRKVPLEERLAASKRLDLGAESVDALEYPYVCDDVAKAWDEASLWYAALKCVQALDDARLALAALPPAPPLAFDWQTPLGWIRVRGGGSDTIDGSGALLVVDLGGDDTYTGPAGASDATRPLGLCLDLAGNDRYIGGAGAQGAGICGVGILLDASGDDRYEAEQYAQGAGQFGFGALFDLSGDDTYVARWSSQGCGYFGIGLLADAAGKDLYTLHADGQGFGGVGGAGVLADRSGDDRYFADPDPAVTGRPSYHSEGKVSVSNAQGCAMGRRGDGADGHSWAGGLGALLDVEGNDSYVAGNWCQGTGYWFGTGLLWEGGGEDSYEGVVWAQATGAHFCIGALVDEDGNDRRLAKQWNSIAFAHDFTIALLVDLGGDDRYECTGVDGIGFSINRSVAMLIDVFGDDTYLGKPGNVPGFARYDERFADYAGLSTYFADASSLGLFLDIGGRDSYWSGAADGAAWGDAPGSDNVRVRNPGVGADVAEGGIDWRPRAVKGKQR